jgi:3-oxoacyl-[acyl-carrier-protein] synthase-1
MTGALAVLGHSMLTAVGDDGATTCAALRAGVSGVRQSPLWDLTSGRGLRVARPQVRQWWAGPTLLAAIAAPVVERCLERARALGLLPGRDGQVGDAAGLPILVILPPLERPARASQLERIVLDGLATRLGRPLPSGSGIVAGGRTGISGALRAALDLLARPGTRGCVIVGVESFLTQPVVDHYIRAGRLLCGGNSNGFIPGEAASAVLVGRAGAVAADELLITGLGQGREASGDGGSAQAPVRGDGLTAAVRDALKDSGIVFHDLNFSISDHNGESFKFKEAAIAAQRLDRLPLDGRTRRPRGFMETWHPADCLGEVGSAVFPLLLGWAFEAGRKGYAPSAHVLLHAGEDNGERVAVVARFRRKE